MLSDIAEHIGEHASGNRLIQRPRCSGQRGGKGMLNAFPVSDWFNLIGFAALIGAGGQGARMIVGLKKLNDATSAQATAGLPTTDMIIASKLLVSLAIGA